MLRALIRPIRKAQFHCGRAAEGWDELVEILRAAAAEPGYAGPSLQSVERVAASIRSTQTAIERWMNAAQNPLQPSPLVTTVFRSTPDPR